MRIDYVWMEDCEYRSGWVDVDPSEALDAAVDALDGRVEAGWVRWHDDACGYDVSSRVGCVVELGAALLDGRDMSDAYSAWCADADIVHHDDGCVWPEGWDF